MTTQKVTGKAGRYFGKFLQFTNPLVLPLIAGATIGGLILSVWDAIKATDEELNQ